MTTSISMNALHGREVTPGHFAWIWGLSLASVLFSTFVLFMRLWSRLLNMSQRFGADDWVAVAAWPFVVTQGILIMFCMRWGIGVHMDDLTDHELSKSNQILVAVLVVYYFNIAFIRVSLSLYYRRIFASSRTFKRVVWANIALNIAWQMAIILSAVFQCNDPRGLWNPEIRAQTHCSEPIIHQYFCSTSSVTLDLVALLLPVPMIMKLQLKPSKKWELLAIFFVGYCVPILTTGRLIDTMITGKNLNTDPSWYWVNILLWLPLESTFAYLGICMPAVLFLSRRWHSSGFGALFSKHATSRHSEPKSSTNGKWTQYSDDNMILKKRESKISTCNISIVDEPIPLDSDGKPITGIIQTKSYTVTTEEYSDLTKGLD